MPLKILLVTIQQINEKTKINPINIIVKIIDFTTSIKNSKLSLIHTPQPNYLILHLRVQRLLI